MLGMAFFKSLVKNHGTQFFEPIGRALQSAGIRKPRFTNPSHLWALKSVMVPYASWMVREKIKIGSGMRLPEMPPRLQEHAEFAASALQKMPSTISGTMRKHQLALADRQCRMADLSGNIQSLLTILCTSLYAARHNDAVVQQAADLFCRETRNQIEARPPDDAYFRDVTTLGKTVVDCGFSPLAGVESEKILMPYKNT